MKKNTLNLKRWLWPIVTIALFGIGISLVMERERFQREIYLLTYKNLPSASTAGRFGASKEKDPIAQISSSDSVVSVASGLHAVALDNNLTLTDVMYKPIATLASIKIERMDISVHLKGRYPAAKKAIAALMSSHPGLALEFLSLQRQKSSDELLDIDLRFTFFYTQAAEKI